MVETYDFIVIGAGTSGAILANRLASTSSKLRVALFESGSKHEGVALRRTYDRFFLAFTQPSLDHGYVTTPQPQFGNREITQFRGRGLGGSTQTNFQLWSLGGRDEFNLWASRTNDEDWNFDSFLESIKQIERLHVDLPEEWNKYVKPTDGAHGFSGEVDVSIGGVVEPEAQHMIEAGIESGYTLNFDQNDGDPIGIGLTPATNKNGIRTTSASAYLERKDLPNLKILTDCQVVKVLFESDKATGVEDSNGKQAFATKEVIICAGAIDSAKLLLLSGVGPKDDLRSLNIELKADLPVGRNLIDHPCVPITRHMGHDFSRRLELLFNSDAADRSAREFENGRGPLVQHYSTTPTAYLQSQTILASKQFEKLPETVQEHLKKPTVPNFEFAMAGPLIPPTYKFDDHDDSYFNFFVTAMNVQSRGEITLSSNSASAKPNINPRFLEHPYDRFVLKTGISEALKWLEAPSLKKFDKGSILGPQSASDEDIEAYIQAAGMGLFHPSCTVKMGSDDDETACLDSDLKVKGLKALRVADLSVPPELPSGHPQIIAYAIGHIAANKIKRDWRLE